MGQVSTTLGARAGVLIALLDGSSAVVHDATLVSLQRASDTSLLFGAVFGDSAPVSFGERAPESSSFKVAAVGGRSGLLPPGVVQNSTVDRLEAKIVDEAEHRGLGVR